MEIISAATLLFLVLDPLGNTPLSLFVLDKVAPELRAISLPSCYLTPPSVLSLDFPR